MTLRRTAATARAIVLLAAVAQCSGCTSSAAPICAGEPVLSETFHAELRPGEGGCAFAATTDVAAANGLLTKIDFSAVVATIADGSALLCLQRPDATPLHGTLVGDVLSVQGAILPASITTQACACALDVVETLTGTFTRYADGSASFFGDLASALTVRAGVDPATCEPTPTSSAPGPSCGAPCQLHWTVTAVR